MNITQVWQMYLRHLEDAASEDIRHIGVLIERDRYIEGLHDKERGEGWNRENMDPQQENYGKRSKALKNESVDLPRCKDSRAINPVLRRSMSISTRWSHNRTES